MSPEQLRSLREARSLTREELAAQLGSCTAQAIVKWERGERPIPSWVEEKMLSNVKVEFPLADLHALLDYARESEESFEQFLSTAVREFLANRRAKQQAPTVTSGAPSANIVPMPPAASSVSGDQKKA